MLLKRTTVIVSAFVAAASAAVVVSAPASADPAVAGTYNTITPTRVVDTRSGLNTTKTALAAHTARTVTVTGPLGSAPVSAVALTVIAFGPGTFGGLVVYPAGTTRPRAANVTFNPRGITSNTVVAKVGTGNKVTVYNASAGPTNLVIDLYGYWTGGTNATEGGLTPLRSARLVDTRDSTPVAARGTLQVPVAGRGGVPKSGVDAVALTVTAVNSPADGYLSVTPDEQTPRPATTSLYFRGAEIRSAFVLVPLNDDGTISVYNSAVRPTNVVVDVQGYVLGGTPAADGAFVTTTQYRADTFRVGEDPLNARSTRKVQLFPDDGSAALFKAVAVNLIAFDITDDGALTAWSGAGTRPATTLDHFAPRAYRGAPPTAYRAVTTIVPVNPDGSISVYNVSDKPISLAVDVAGFALNDDLGSAPGAQQRVRAALAHARSFSAHR